LINEANYLVTEKNAKAHNAYDSERQNAGHKAKTSQGLRKFVWLLGWNHQHQSDKISNLQKAQLQG
jgi:hypothetical protein